jgi:hypothetical protein
MNRRGFLKFLAAIPVIRHVPLPKGIFGSGNDGDITLTGRAVISPYEWKNYGGGGGGGGSVFVYCKTAKNITITARGGNGGDDHA